MWHVLFAKKLNKIRQIWPWRSLKHFTAAYRGFPPCTQSQPPANRETGYSNVLVTLGHFDILDIWDLQVYWKMSRIPYVSAINWRKSKEMTTRHPPKSPVQTQTPPIRPYETPKHPLTPQTQSPFFQEQSWLLQSTCQTVWGAFELSKDVRRDSGRNEVVRRCLLSVRNVWECLRLPLAMSGICHGWYLSVWGYLRVSGGV